MSDGISVFVVVRDKGPGEDQWDDSWSIFRVVGGSFDSSDPIKYAGRAVQLHGGSLSEVARDVYDWTQYSEAINSGDLIYMVDPSTLDVAVVILDKAWPVQISGDQLPSLHHYKIDPRYRPSR
jgi:hypothetical protein